MDSANFPRLSLTPIAQVLRQRSAWLGAAGLAVPSLALAGPSGGQVVGGHAEINTPSGNTTTIDQSTHSAVINWQTFSIGGEEYVVFNQPSSSSVALNRVLGGAPSEIFGHLLANGRVFLVNPSGLLFAPGAHLDVGGLVATTMSISDEDFMEGRYVFTEGGDGEVVNAGSLHAGDNGFVVLAGDHVRNAGLIQARLGEVVLASGRAMTLDLSGDGLVGFSVDAASVSQLAGVENLGQITADGGSVLMTAAVARGLLGTVVNNAGLVRAQSIDQGADGSIMLSASGGDISQSGTLDASATGSARAGSIHLLADGDIELASGSRTVARGGANGTGGEVRTIAEGDLYSAGSAQVDVRGGTTGGLVELSGHRGITIRGSQQIGPGGRLLIDPSEISIGAMSGQGCEFDYCYELLEDVLVQGADVDLVAQDLISFYATADGHFDGRNAQGTGGSLLVGIGSIDGRFYAADSGSVGVADGSNNAFLMDGDIAIYAGSDSGSITGLGDLSGAGIDLSAGDDIQVGNLSSSAGSVDVYAGGSVALASLASRSETSDASGVSSAHVAISAGSALDTGNIEATALDGTNSNIAAVTLSALNDIATGSISTTTGGTGGTGSADIALYAQTGSIATGALSSQGGPNDDTSVYLSAATNATSADITSDGSATLYAGSGIVTGNVMAQGSINIDTTAGDLRTGHLSLGAEDSYEEGYGGPVALRLYADDGSITTGDIALDSDGPASLSTFAAGSLSTGSISLHAGPNGGGGYNNYGAQVYLAATDGVSVNGDLSVGAEAASDEYFGDSFSYSRLEGSAVAQIEGSAVTIAGDTAIAGYGDSGLYIGSAGDVSSGDIAIDAGAAEYSEFGEGYGYEERYGQAYLQIAGGDRSRITLGSVSLLGPEAGVGIQGGSIAIDGDFHASARAAGSEGSIWERETADEIVLVESTFAGVGVRMTALGGEVSVAGDLSLDGPTTGLTLAALDGVTIDGALRVAASGYTVDGDATRLLDEDGFDGSLVSTLLLPPVLEEGRTEWGGAGILIGGPTLENGVQESTDFTSQLSIGGDLSVSGQGIALAQMQTDTLSVGGTLSTDAARGSLQGSWREGRTIDGSVYEVTRSVSGTDGEGPARHAISGIFVAVRDGDATLGDVSASGGNAYIQFDGGNHWTVGDISVAGGLGALANDYADIASFTAQDDIAPAIGDTQTQLVGGLNGFAVGDEAGGPPLRFDSGDISVSGSGQAALVVVADNASTGALSVLAENGLVDTDDPTVLAQPLSLVIGDASLQVDTDSALASGTVSVDAQGNAHLGGSLASSGDVSINSAGLIDHSIPIEYLPISPLSNGANVQVNGGGAAAPRSNIPLLPLNIAAEGAVTMDFSANSALDELALSGSTVDVNGHGASLVVGGDATLGADARLDLGNTALAADSIALSGEIDVSQASLSTTRLSLHEVFADLSYGDFEGERLSLTADNGSISAGNIDVSTLTVNATGNLALGDLDISESLTLAAVDAAGTQILIGDIAYGGALDFSYANANVTLGDVNTQSLTLALGNGDASFGSIEADSLDVSAASISSLGSSINAEQIAMTADGALALDGSQLTAGRIDLSGDSLGLGDTSLVTADLALRQFSGDLAFGDFEGERLSLTADNGSISAGNIDVSTLTVNAAGALALGDLDISESLTLAAGDAAGTQILIGDIAYGGALDFSYANANVTLGDVNTQSLTLALGNGDASFGSIEADSLDVSAINILSQDSNLVAEAVDLLAANALTLDTVGINAGSAALRAGNTLSLSNSSITADQLELTADEADVSLASSSLNADSVAIRAGGDVVASGAETAIDAGGLGVIAGDRIELAEAQLTAGTAESPFAGDDTLIARLPAALRPSSLNPNAAFTAGGGIRLGALNMAGDHLYLHTNSLRFSGNITAPTDLFVQFRPYDDALSLGIENLASTTQDINFTVDQHITVFPGTTLAFGGSTYAGNIVVGDSAALDLAGHDSNFIFLTSGTISGATQKIPTNGQVVVLGGTVLDVPEPEPGADPGINSAVPPDPEGDSLPGAGGVLVSSADIDDEDELIDETAGGQDVECE